MVDLGYRQSLIPTQASSCLSERIRMWGSSAGGRQRGMCRSRMTISQLPREIVE